jgi:hypothetical protein
LAGYFNDVIASPAFDVEAESVFFLRGIGKPQLVEKEIECVKIILPLTGWERKHEGLSYNPGAAFLI